MPELHVLASSQLSRRLFDTPERWGWEFHDPGRSRSHPALQERPLWREPEAPDLSALHATVDAARKGALRHVVIVAVLMLIAIALGDSGVLLFVAALGLAALWFGPMLLALRTIRARQEEHAQALREASQRHAEQERAWQESVDDWNHAEQQRIAAANLWFPLHPRRPAARVEIFGGTPEGWAAFLATMGTGLLNDGKRVVVVDLSENEVGAPLAALARRQEIPVRRIDLPAELDRARLLSELGPEDVSEVIAEALHTRRSPGDLAPRILDADILKAIAQRLDAPVTFAKLVAALRVLQRSSDLAVGGPLSARETQQITEYVDLVGDGERVSTQLQELRSTLEALTGTSLTSGEQAAGDQGRSPDDEHEIGGPGLTLLATDDHIARRRDIVDRLVVQSLIHRLRLDTLSLRGSVLVVVGADHLGREALESLSRAARRAGVRLFLMIEHLREEYESFLGSSDSAALFMRMGNAKEAMRAAEHIGRRYTFQLAQLTRQQGSTSTHGTSFTEGTSTTVTETTGTNVSKSGELWHLTKDNKTTGKSTSTSKASGTSQEWGVSDSRAESLTEGVTQSRVYEFTVDPTQFQDLDVASFVLVEPLPDGGRRVLAATCDPQVLTQDRLSDTEFDDALREVQTGAIPYV